VRSLLLYFASVTMIAVLAIALAASFVALNCGVHAFDSVAFYKDGQCALPQSPYQLFRTIAVNGGIVGVVVVTIGNLWTIMANRARK
jgi:hypothetical protein